MPSLKTIVRELGVIYWMDRHLKEEKIAPEDVKPEEFYERCKDILGPIPEASRVENKEKFRSNKQQILRNTYWLAKRLIKTFEINEIREADWIGPNTQDQMPIDIKINGKEISLKDDSYIIENMGLYKVINLFTDEDYNSGSWHIFEDFANDLYQEWFRTSWNFLIEASEEQSGLIWSDESVDYTREIHSEDSKIILKYKDRESELDENISNTSEFDENTISKTREVFGKWLNEVYLENASEDKQKEYNRIKKKCSMEAGENLEEYLESNLDIKYDNLLRLLRIHERGYYYAKAAEGKCSIYKVPSKEQYDRTELEVIDFEPSIPDSQLNLITTLKNNETGGVLKLRNEIRFSHRQFNGSPEAKMYLVENYDLSPVYRLIDEHEYNEGDLRNSLGDFI